MPRHDHDHDHGTRAIRVLFKYMTDRRRAIMKTQKKQSGYMIEIPIGIALVIFILSVLLPKLPLVAAKALAIMGALLVTAGAFYMLIVPGWQPNSSGRLGRPWNWIVFILIAIALIGAAVAFAILG
jgi:hypothetical protein